MVDVAALAAGVAAGRRAEVSRAITLVESRRPDHRSAARDLVHALADAAPSPPAVRVGISGVPGVGKSTFIETLGMRLLDEGHRVGVLAVDPSSVRTGGSVLGDKTRMARLAVAPDAFVRPSPTAGTLGGVAKATSLAMTVLEAAAYDVVLVETVGVGQSEITVAGMVDTFCFLTLARTGDALQGIKKGILEIADVIAVNKADDEGARASGSSSEPGGGPRAAEAKVAARDLRSALRMVRGRGEEVPSVVTCSGLTGAGVDDVWAEVLAHRDRLGADGLETLRARQHLAFTAALVTDTLEERFRRSRGVRDVRADIEAAVLAGDLTAPEAADRLLAAYDSDPR